MCELMFLLGVLFSLYASAVLICAVPALVRFTDRVEEGRLEELRARLHEEKRNLVVLGSRYERLTGDGSYRDRAMEMYLNKK